MKKRTRYVWAKKEILYPGKPCLLFLTRTKLKFGDRVFINKDAFAQRKETQNCVGYVLSTKKNMTPHDLIRLENKLARLMARAMMRGTYPKL